MSRIEFYGNENDISKIIRECVEANAHTDSQMMAMTGAMCRLHAGMGVCVWSCRTHGGAVLLALIAVDVG